ncbi:lytic murein transglycosylase [Tropicimonas sp. TH_r6]|uniref:lytic murein transglycosylase n=1 Tax=Tropicimonas sp. TH_r6 TaxID=3082085 RepID=UPI0029536198|nr:lytic murein transglycosylase [Tropicimonas sp. TH_r6]MDV7144724.1 lytic murein transglycosylase [Tropicimonas sp. TH_r6]
MEDSFRDWLAGFRREATAEGLDCAPLDGLEPLPEVLQRDRGQAEFTLTIRDYLDRAVSPERLAEGRRQGQARCGLLTEITARFGVPAEILLAIWGLESNFGVTRGDLPALRALATLACDGRRRAFFEAELRAALRILSAGDVAADEMLGSWAGAMGHMQFMPSTFLAHAVDFDGDGQRDIWAESPVDALASAASYLAAEGWQSGQGWAEETCLPQGVDIGLTGRETALPLLDWTQMGLRGPGGAVHAGAGLASVLLPAGHRGPAILIHQNFTVLRRYNAADSYVLAVGLLADGIAGRPGLRASWPAGLTAPSRAEMRQLQAALTEAGFDTQGADGIVGPNTIAAIRAFQRSRGLPPDGYPSAALLSLSR